MRRHLARFLRWCIGAGLILPLLWSFAPVWAQAPEVRRAGIVVVHGDGRVVMRCVTFSEESISGLDLLNRSGLVPGFASGPMGSTLCSLNGEGCPNTDCFCECKGTPCTYWNYFHLSPDGAWSYAGIGAAARSLRDGDVDGWVWGDGAAAPPGVSFDAICSASVAPVASSPALTATPAPTKTVAPTPTSAPSSTPTPSATPLPPVPSAAPTTLPTSTLAPTFTATATPTERPIPMPTLAPETPEPVEPLTEPAMPLLSYGVFGLLVLALGGFYWWQRKR